MSRPGWKHLSDEEMVRYIGRRAADRLSSYEELRAGVVDLCRRLREREEGDRALSTKEAKT